MVQNMTYGSWWSNLKINNYFVIKFGILLLLSFAFRILYGVFSPYSENPFIGKSHILPPNVTSVHSQESKKQIPFQGFANSDGKCDLFTGNWIPFMGGPSYTNLSCSFIPDHQNCMKNGRPDSDYLYWRWKPLGCNLPRFNASRFLSLMKNKTLASIGDSISGNHLSSLLCILSTVENPVDVYHDEDWKNRKWIFPSYNFSVSVVWSPFLAKAATFVDNDGNAKSEVELHIDILDKSWTDLYTKHDYTIISCGKWFDKSALYYENDIMVGCYNSTRNCTELRFDFAYRKIIRKVFNYILKTKYKGMVLYKTSTPDHFENGEWFTGGTCKRTVPTKEGEFELNKFDRILRTVELEELEKVPVKASQNGLNLKIFDVHPLSLMRPDGHPGPYRFFQPFAKDKDAKVINDCLHWCLPGPIDSWNDLLMGMVVNG